MRLRPAVLAVAALPLLLSLGHVLPPAGAKAPRSLVPDPAVRAVVKAVAADGRETVRPGQPATVTGSLLDRKGKPATGTFTLRVSDETRRELGRLPVTTAEDGTFSAVVPGSVTQGVETPKETGYVTTLAVRVTDVKAGGASEQTAGSTGLKVAAAPDGLELTNDFTSARGWVKPGERYPFRLVVRNYGGAVTDPVVTLPPVTGMRFTNQRVAAGSGSVSISGGTITWALGTVAAATSVEEPTIYTLIVEGQADSVEQNPEIVWRDISTTATLTYGSTVVTSESHGPKVIPQDEIYDTARFGDRPFPVVPVDYVDLKHTSEHSGTALANKINSPAIEGSTFNLFQENSFGQLYPNGTVPSAGIANDVYDKPIDFSNPEPQGGCPPDAVATTEPAYPTGLVNRIEDGWYQLPRTINYYGSDRYFTQSAFVGANLGQAVLFDIDSACGPAAKAVYDAAAIADEEIDYSDFDTDKDGVVDFFMMVYAGVGGHGASVTETPPYDNIWPHSSSLEFSYTDPTTKQGGYVSQDQLKDLEGRPLWYTDEQRVTMTTTPGPDNLIVKVRVGPYNVNPEDSIDHASVISHEYGHSLGLPDFYSTGNRTTYGDWNLMATDKSQNMDVFSKQDMGWIVPRVLPKNATTKVSDWKDSKVNTNEITWARPDGTEYTLPNHPNGEAYTAKLPGRQLVSPQKLEQGASPTHVWWSGSGNDYGCPPEGGRNLDISLPDLADIPATADVKVTFKSYWDIEWDYDYGFVLISPNNGQSYTSVASEKGYTTPIVQNPHTNNCQARYGNGITGTSGSYAAGTAQADRTESVPGRTPYPDGPFLEDSYDISALAGQASPVLRFTYATDPGLAHPGWFIDDLKITVDGEPIFESDFESFEKDQPRIFNGGCKEDLRVATRCTKGWQYVSSSVASTADHGYYMEMRDRSGFDFDGKGENDRAAIAFNPGMLLVYTDEAHGYGNAGTDDPPAQSPLDAEPTAGALKPNLNDAAFTAGSSFSDTNHVDNYLDPRTESGNWEFRFQCLSFKVDSMSGDSEGPDSPLGVGGDLVGDVTFKTTKRCADFNYGYVDSEVANVAPSAALAVKPASPRVGERVTFDGSESFDDRQAPNDLTYSWSFGDGSSARGRTTSHVYSAAGKYTVTLTVTDADGAKTNATRTITVGAASSGGPGAGPGGGPVAGGPTEPAHPATGGGEIFALLAVLGAAAAALLRRRTVRP